MHRSRSRAVLLGLALTALPVLAQGSERSGYSYLSYVGSDVSLVSQGDEDSAARVNTPIMPGDRLSTGTASRAEAVLADGNVVRLDVRTDLKLERLARTYEADDDRDLLFLERGTIAVETRFASTRSQAVRVDTADATVVFAEQGLFRVDVGRRGTEIYVLEGKAEVNARSGRANVRAGEWAWVSGDDEIEVDSADFPRDRFTRFVSERRERGRRTGTVTQYVPAEYEYDYYANDLDDYGSWVYVSSYNRYCWRPRTVADWTPYSQGYWRWTPCGLTWVSYESWGWMPYHYGSWFADASFGWCWLPGTVYSPAWVYWSYSPGYVGWCPVGYYGSWYYDHYYRSTRTLHGFESAYYPHLRGRVDLTQIDRRGWNYVPTNRFGGKLDPRTDVVRGDRLRLGRNEVGVVSTAPLRIDRAGNIPISTAVREAVRRVPVVEAGRPLGVDEGITGVLRREANPNAQAQEVLRRSAVRVGHDPAYRSVTPEGIASPRRLEPAGTTASGREVVAGPGGGTLGTSRTGDTPRRFDFDRERGGPSRAAEGTRTDTATGDTPVRREAPPAVAAAPRGDDGWRAPSPGSGGRAFENRRIEDRRPSTQENGGWRAPDADRRLDGTARGELRREATSPRAELPVREAPVREAPVREVPRERPSWRSSEAPRQEAPGRVYEAPRVEPRREVQRYESPRFDSSPRYEAPRREAPPAPRYEPPQRYEAPRYQAPRYEAPRAQPHFDAPRQAAPAPRYEAPRPAAPPPAHYQAPQSAPAPAPAPHRVEPPSHAGRG